MSDRLHRLILLRHGETEWSATGRHTGRTELELTETGREQAVLARPALAELQLTDPLVISSPRRRALATAELAGLHVDEVDPVLSEWDYGDYEGLTTQEIRQTVPDWLVWTHGCPGGGDRRAGQLSVPIGPWRRRWSMCPTGMWCSSGTGISPARC